MGSLFFSCLRRPASGQILPCRKLRLDAPGLA